MLVHDLIQDVENMKEDMNIRRTVVSMDKSKRPHRQKVQQSSRRRNNQAEGEAVKHIVCESKENLKECK